MKRNNVGGLVLCGIAALAMTCAVARADTAFSNKWRIEVSEGANASGTMVLRVMPSQGSPTDVTVEVKGGRGENGVARDIRDALAAQLSADRFKVEVDDGEDVLVKRLEGQPDFTLEVVQSSVPGTRVAMDRE